MAGGPTAHAQNEKRKGENHLEKMVKCNKSYSTPVFFHKLKRFKLKGQDKLGMIHHYRRRIFFTQRVLTQINRYLFGLCVHVPVISQMPIFCRRGNEGLGPRLTLMQLHSGEVRLNQAVGIQNLSISLHCLPIKKSQQEKKNVSLNRQITKEIQWTLSVQPCQN